MAGLTFGPVRISAGDAHPARDPSSLPVRAAVARATLLSIDASAAARALKASRHRASMLALEYAKDGSRNRGWIRPTTAGSRCGEPGQHRSTGARSTCEPCTGCSATAKLDRRSSGTLASRRTTPSKSPRRQRSGQSALQASRRTIMALDTGHWAGRCPRSWRHRQPRGSLARSSRGHHDRPCCTPPLRLIRGRIA